LIIAGLSSCRADDPWDTTCRLYDAYEESEGRNAGACDQLDAPKIVYEEMRDGLMGYYDAGDTIFVNSETEGDFRTSVLIHEMVHYIDKLWLDMQVPGPAVEICKSEDKAWFIEGVWWGLIGRPDEARTDWWKSYPHCWEWYAPRRFELTMDEFVHIMDIGDDIVVIEVP
jgi:hypothetical protein